jgi:hypothetical protein
MHIRAQLSNDHAEIRSLGSDILGAAGDEGPGGRDNQFDLFDRKLRRHLSAVEDAILVPLERDDTCASAVSDLEHRHKQLRKELGALRTDPKESAEWSSRFERLLADLEGLIERHDGLIGMAATKAGDDDALARRYTKAKLKRMSSGSPWARVGIGAGAVAALAAGAAVAAAATRARQRRGHGGRMRGAVYTLETDEDVRLIASDKVQDTPVIGSDGDRIGHIQKLMIDKYTGHVAYAVLTFGGTMGFGGHLFPVPWSLLDYDEDEDGYVLDTTREQLEAAPRFEASHEPEFSPVYRRQVTMFYRPSLI